MDKSIKTLVLAFFLLLAATTGDAGGSAAPALEQQPAVEYVPASPVGRYQGVNKIPLAAFTNLGGEPFRHCADCQCCAAKDPSSCQTMKCCYVIVCNLPGKPFGECAFQPKTCDCNNCQ